MWNRWDDDAKEDEVNQAETEPLTSLIAFRGTKRRFQDALCAYLKSRSGPSDRYVLITPAFCRLWCPGSGVVVREVSLLPLLPLTSDLLLEEAVVESLWQFLCSVATLCALVPTARTRIRNHPSFISLSSAHRFSSTMASSVLLLFLGLLLSATGSLPPPRISFLLSKSSFLLFNTAGCWCF